MNDHRCPLLLKILCIDIESIGNGGLILNDKLFLRFGIISFIMCTCCIQFDWYITSCNNEGKVDKLIVV